MNEALRMLLGLKHEYPKTSESDNHKTIAVLVPAYNEESVIANTILSLKKQTRVPDEIIVVDDCSQDKTGAIAKSLGARVIRTKQNTGTKSQAQNAALPYIKSDYTVTIDGDTISHRKAIEHIVKPLTDPNVASACGVIVPQRIKTFWEKARFIEYAYGISLMKKAQDNLGAILVSSGCMSAFRTKELQQHGFNPRTLAEDMDLTWQFLISGRRVAFVKEAICYPMDPPNFRIYWRQLDRWYRAFFQNIVVHRKDLKKCKRLLFFVIWYLGENLLVPAFWILFPFLLFRSASPIGSSIISVIIGIIIMHWSVVIGMSFWYTRGMKKKLLVIRSLPCYFLASFVNSAIFLQAFFKEWILHHKLDKWEKGH